MTYNQVGGSGFNSANNISLYQTPDVILKAALDPGWGHYEAFGISREFYNRFGGTNHTEHGGGFGLGMILALVPKILDFQFRHERQGHRPLRYRGPFRRDLPSRRQPGSDQGNHAARWPHPACRQRRGHYAFGGQERQQKEAFNVGTTPYGYGNPLYVNSGCDIQGSALTCVGNTRKISQGTLGFWWRFYQGKYGKGQSAPRRRTPSARRSMVSAALRRHRTTCCSPASVITRSKL